MEHMHTNQDKQLAKSGHTIISNEIIRSQVEHYFVISQHSRAMYCVCIYEV